MRIERLKDYIALHSRGQSTNPFKVREGIWAMHEALSTDPLVPDDRLDDIASSARALNGVCDLHVDLAFSSALRPLRSRRKRAFIASAEQWKVSARERFEAEAVAEVAQIRRLEK